jgi:hypothetical protein
MGAELGLWLAFGGREDRGVGLCYLAHVAMVQAANFGDLDDPAHLGGLDGPDARRPAHPWREQDACESDGSYEK